MSRIRTNSAGDVYLWIGEPFNVGQYVPRETVVSLAVGACRHPEHGKPYNIHVTKKGVTLQGTDGRRTNPPNENARE